MQHCKQSRNTNAIAYAFIKAFEGHEGHEGLASGLLPTDPDNKYLYYHYYYYYYF